jgi:hypothetical protein
MCGFPVSKIIHLEGKGSNIPIVVERSGAEMNIIL